MTLVQMQPRSTNVTPAPTTAADVMDADALQVCDDMIIEVALSVMAGARTGHLFVCDNDGLCAHLVTQVQLTAVRDSPAYTDRVQLRDILGGSGPFTSPLATTAEAEHAALGRRLAALPVVEDQDGARGVHALAH
ncbi:CBS domain-containing protein [Streptomyces sp. NPDC014733]|uniref:CBS domain-containing protein n=1 Tax=Streptomyces sp. NPDC014733 TaxID=3364885 RepID=UPI0036F70CF4